MKAKVKKVIRPKKQPTREADAEMSAMSVRLEGWPETDVDVGESAHSSLPIELGSSSLCLLSRYRLACSIHKAEIRRMAFAQNLSRLIGASIRPITPVYTTLSLFESPSAAATRAAGRVIAALESSDLRSTADCLSARRYWRDTRPVVDLRCSRRIPRRALRQVFRRSANGACGGVVVHRRFDSCLADEVGSPQIRIDGSIIGNRE